MRYGLASILWFSLLTLAGLCPAQEQRIDVTFGRAVVESRGVDGERISSYVDLYDSEGDRIGGGKTGKEGDIAFNVRGGVYRAVVYANNFVEIAGIRVLPGQETRVRSDWGKLTLSFNEPGAYATFHDSTGDQVLGQGIGKSGRLSCYLKPGLYWIQVHSEPMKEFRNLVVRANQETLAGSFVNHPPKITGISSDPPAVKAGQSARITVEARDDDGDELTFTYKPNVGRIEGRGDRVIYHAPQQKGAYRVSVGVADPHGGTETFDYYLSSGDLTVRTLTAGNEPINGTVHIFDPLGSRVAVGNAGPTGTRTWQLRQGRYRLEVVADNMIEVPGVQVDTDQTRKVDVAFGRLVVESFGVAGDRVPASVDLFDSDGKKAGTSRAGKNGETVLNVREGLYRALVYLNNDVEITGIQIAPGRETRVRSDWGKLTLNFPDPGKTVSLYDSTGRKVVGQALSQAGRLSCYLSPGTYRAEVFTEPPTELRDLVVHANRETITGGAANHVPRITDIWSDPPLVKPGGAARIRVEAKDEDGDPLTYTYTPNLGRIEGKGREVLYHAPQQKGPYRVNVSVSDPHGASDSLDYSVSGGELTVRAFTAKGEPFNALVHIFDSMGTRLEAGNVGPGGTKTWQLREGLYSLHVFGDNRIEVPDVHLAADQKRQVEVPFGRVVVESRGVNGERIPATVVLYDAQGERVGSSQFGASDEAVFHVREGVYRAVASVNNQMEISGIRVVPGRETRVRADWGRLTLSFNDPGTYAIFYDSSGQKILGQILGKGDRLSSYLRPGTYRVEILTEPRRDFRSLEVRPNEETIAGDASNHPPRITNISCTPNLLKAGETGVIRVEATDDDGDPLTYSYTPVVGRIEGSGEEVLYHAPLERGPYHIIIGVSDPHGESHVFDCFVSGGDLYVRTFTGHEEPLDAAVHVYNSLGVQVASGPTGPEGTGGWRLPEGRYKLQVLGHNTIEVPEVEVVTDLDAFAVVNFGKLVVQCFGVDNRPLNTYVVVRTDSEEKVAGESTGEDGTIEFNLCPGLYHVQAFQANVITRPRVRVDSQQEYVVALNPSALQAPQISSGKPAIEQILVKPVRTSRLREFRISTLLSGGTSEGVSFRYYCEGGTVVGSGPEVIVKGAENRPLKVYISVQSPSGAETTAEVHVPAARKQP